MTQRFRCRHSGGELVWTKPACPRQREVKARPWAEANTGRKLPPRHAGRVITSVCSHCEEQRHGRKRQPPRLAWRSRYLPRRAAKKPRPPLRSTRFVLL